MQTSLLNIQGIDVYERQLIYQLIKKLMMFD